MEVEAGLANRLDPRSHCYPPDLPLWVEVEEVEAHGWVHTSMVSFPPDAPLDLLGEAVVEEAQALPLCYSTLPFPFASPLF